MNTFKYFFLLLGWCGTIRINNERSHRAISLSTNALVLMINELKFIILNGAELYCSLIKTSTITGNKNHTQQLHTSLMPSHKKTLLTGEKNNTNYLNSTGLYDPSTGIWTTTTSINHTQREHLAPELSGRKVLVAARKMMAQFINIILLNIPDKLNHELFRTLLIRSNSSKIVILYV